MQVSEKILVIFHLALCLFAAQVAFSGPLEDELSPSAARNLRAEAQFHFKLASDAQNKMSLAELHNDVDSYEKYRNKMREHDEAMWEAGNKYDELRDYLEKRIWDGNLVIKGFEKAYEKSTADSILDHLLFRSNA